MTPLQLCVIFRAFMVTQLIYAGGADRGFMVIV